jgi:Protein of unknown function (DUF2569)
MVDASDSHVGASQVSTDPPQGAMPPPLQTVEKTVLSGFGGWLFVLAFGLLAGAIITGIGTISNLGPLFRNNAFLTFFQAGSSTYNPTLGIFIVVELLANALLIVWTFCCLRLLVLKRPSFPEQAKRLMGASVVIVFADLAITAALFDAPVTAKEVGGAFRVLLANTIWFTYLNTSLRVKNTFPPSSSDR